MDWTVEGYTTDSFGRMYEFSVTVEFCDTESEAIAEAITLARSAHRGNLLQDRLGMTNKKQLPDDEIAVRIDGVEPN